jgi:phosphodiesterase/alkaline phosphatase D-like protein
MYPMRESIVEPGRVYRTINYGPHLDVFVLGRAQLSRRQRRQSRDQLWAIVLFHRAGADALAEAGAVELAARPGR